MKFEKQFDEGIEKISMKEFADGFSWEVKTVFDFILFRKRFRFEILKRIYDER